VLLGRISAGFASVRSCVDWEVGCGSGGCEVVNWDVSCLGLLSFKLIVILGGLLSGGEVGPGGFGMSVESAVVVGGSGSLIMTSLVVGVSVAFGAVVEDPFAV
jgi:hypothetical protein